LNKILSTDNRIELADRGKVTTIAMQLFLMLNTIISEEKANIIVQDNLVLKTYEDLNNILASYSLPALGQIFTQYSKLFLNEKKKSVENSCSSSKNFSKIYCKSIGQIENIAKNKTNYVALKINQLIAEVN
jgi:hypothetical protein